MSPPFDRTETSDTLRSQRRSNFHAGPSSQKRRQIGDGLVGPTTSMHMESFEREFIEQTGVNW
ncbi:fumarate hydratase C-terminal domain-containing protein [Shigella flexneri]